jgi:hypothetical protein
MRTLVPSIWPSELIVLRKIASTGLTVSGVSKRITPTKGRFAGLWAKAGHKQQAQAKIPSSCSQTRLLNMTPRDFIAIHSGKNVNPTI